jgi:hypothetical protein
VSQPGIAGVGVYDAATGDVLVSFLVGTQTTAIARIR